MGFVTKGDFCPVNKWRVYEEGAPWRWEANKGGNRWKPVALMNINGTYYAKKPNGDLCHLTDNEKKTVFMYLIDPTTGRFYLNQSTSCVRVKCLALALGTPLVHTIMSVLNVGYLILKLVTLSHFWMKKEGENTYSFKARLKSAGQDALRIVTTPFALIALEFSALYGVLRPYDGRKLYATFERAQYGNSILAPCFQPSPTSHALGGDVNNRSAW